MVITGWQGRISAAAAAMMGEGMMIMTKPADRKGFTLLELIVAIVIIGIIVAIASINYRTYKNNLQMREDSKSFEALLKYSQQEAQKTLILSRLQFRFGGSENSTLTADTRARDLRIEVRNGGSTTPLRQMIMRGVSFRHNLSVMSDTEKQNIGIHIDIFDTMLNEELGSIGFLNNGFAFSVATPSTSGQPSFPLLMRISRGTLGFDYTLESTTGVLRYTDFTNAW